MRNILRIFADDVRLATSNPIALLMLVGLCLVPALCAWFNIAGNWDPSANTDRLKVAIANEDAGYSGEFAPLGVNFGDKVVADLRGNEKYGWTFVGEDEAVEGVKSGAYHAAIVIPADFSSKLMTMLSANSESAEVAFYVNPKTNPSAPMTAASGEAMIADGAREAFNASVDEAVLSALSDIVSIADSEDMQTATSLLASRLDNVSQALTVASEQVSAYSSLLNSASRLSTSASKLLEGSKDSSDENDEGDEGDAAESSDDDSENAIGTLASDIQDAVGKMREAVSELEDALPQANGDTEDESGETADQLISNARSLADSAESVAEDAKGISDSLTETVKSLAAPSESLASDFKSVREALGKVSSSLKESAKEVAALSSGVVEASSSGDLSKLASLVGDNAGTIAKFLATPVKVNRETVYPVEPYGSSMAPFYNALALWVGAIILVMVMRTRVSEERFRKLVNPRNSQIYIGRFLIYAVIAFLQATVVWAGDIFFLRIQCEQPFMMLVACWVCSLVFCNIVYTLAASFGEIGKALCVIMLVLQVVGFGGEYPVQVMGDFFQALHPFMPFTYAIAAMQECVAGLYANNFVIDVLKLLTFLVPSLILGLGLRIPLIRLMDHLDVQLERTGIM